MYDLYLDINILLDGLVCGIADIYLVCGIADFNYFRTLKRTEYKIFQLDEVQVFQNLTHPFSSTHGHDFLFTRTS